MKTKDVQLERGCSLEEITSLQDEEKHILSTFAAG